MISLDLEQTYLLELIKSSLFGSTPEIPEHANWEKIFEAANAQCIVPLLTPIVPLEFRNEWNEISYRSKAHFMQMIYEQNEIVDLLNENQIPFVILKGTTAAFYYPQPLLRAFGDVDLYISEAYLDVVLRLFNYNKYNFVSSNERHYEFVKNGIDIELHSKFSCEYYNNIDHIVLHGLNNAVQYKIGNYTFWGLPKYENGLVLLGHIMQHLKGSGIGLRQVIDWMMYVHRELDDIAWENNFRPLAVEAGLEKIAINITGLCKKWLGLPDKITWCDDSVDEIVDQLLIFILDDGNLGQDRALYEVIKNSMKAEGTFRFLQRMGMVNWTLAKKYVAFRPFAWFYQLCKYVSQGVFGLLSGKKMFFKYKHKMSIEELIERME